MSDSHGTVCWSELMTRDPAAAKDYYGKVAGWSFSTMAMDGGTDYHVASIGDKMVAGIMDVARMEGMEGVPPTWFTYIAVDDVDLAVQQTRDGGGTVNREPWDIAGVGRIAIVTDPTGATFGLMTPSS